MILLVFLCWAVLVTAEITEEEGLEEDEGLEEGGRLEEEERLVEYHRRGYVWPLTATRPNTKGWRRNMFYRIAQVQHIEDSDERYTGWMQIMPSAVVHPNFTENGWGLTRAPEYLMEELRASLRNGLGTAQEEEDDSIDDGDLHPVFIQQEELNQKVLEALKPMHEKWSGVPLTGEVAYGLRVYRNNTRMTMHVDRVETHIISSIIHVDKSEDAEPWPIFIEDYQGNTNEVYLTSGDMLFYESSKCIHGRPRRFNGSWYSNIFVHYYPTDWDTEQAELEVYYSLPPNWDVGPYDPSVAPGIEKLEMSGTGMKEPNCPDWWCGTVDTVKWEGPAKEGVVITTGYVGDEGAEL